MQTTMLTMSTYSEKSWNSSECDYEDDHSSTSSPVQRRVSAPVDLRIVQNLSLNFTNPFSFSFSLLPFGIPSGIPSQSPSPLPSAMQINNSDLEVNGTSVITTHSVSSVIKPGDKQLHDPLQFVKIKSNELSQKVSVLRDREESVPDGNRGDLLGFS